ncbi:hypothetical protein ACRALDRAFT_211610 [Sodiomyces alcalophilus JCM 7366]|uniref:uncharacterized protein n=1 Tax=Sodiomyces alcalophilus JCM 7366 TaxID=591952 RepID=UPI0039B57FFE
MLGTTGLEGSRIVAARRKRQNNPGPVGVPILPRQTRGAPTEVCQTGLLPLTAFVDFTHLAFEFVSLWMSKFFTNAVAYMSDQMISVTHLAKWLSPQGTSSKTREAGIHDVRLLALQARVVKIASLHVPDMSFGNSTKCPGDGQAISFHTEFYYEIFIHPFVHHLKVHENDNEEEQLLLLVLERYASYKGFIYGQDRHREANSTTMNNCCKAREVIRKLPVEEAFLYVKKRCRFPTSLYLRSIIYGLQASLVESEYDFRSSVQTLKRVDGIHRVYSIYIVSDDLRWQMHTDTTIFTPVL